jgi:hypothetical protein
VYWTTSGAGKGKCKKISFNENVGYSLTLCKISTRLPFPDSGRSIPAICSSVFGTKEIAAFKDLSPLGKMVCISDFCTSVCEHAISPLDEGSSFITAHSYWLDHYHFAQALSSLALATSLEQSEEEDPILQFADISVQIAIIHLQKGAIDRGKHVTSMEAIINDSKKKCLQAAIKISSVVQGISSSGTTPVSISLFKCCCDCH